MDRLNKLLKLYYKAHAFKMLREKTQTDYIYFLSVANLTLKDTKLNKLTPVDANRYYQEWLNKGVSFANHVATCVSTVLNWGIQLGYIQSNPFSNIKRVTATKRTDIWTKEDVKKVLDYAYTDFKSRNIGLIIQMAYEFCQRVGDMRTLKWENFNDDMSVLYLQQSKRRAKVELPVYEELQKMLIEQRKDFGFQQYVAPNIKPVGGEYEPYTLYSLSKKGRLLMNNAGVSKSIRLMDLRRTGIMEMVDGGVSLPQIMSVSGHANPQSVKPYMKNTFDSANNALTMRKNSIESAMKQQEGV